MQMPMAAQAVLLGGNVRVGLEDNLWLDRACWPATANWWNAPRDHHPPGRPRAEPGRRPGKNEPQARWILQETDMPFITEIKTFAALGSGVIGSGWVARALAHGLDVVAWDPAPGAEAALRKRVANAWPALEKQGLAPARRRTACVRRHHRGMRARRRLHPGKRPGAPGPETRPARKISAAAKPTP
jgi:hypothetical protein